MSMPMALERIVKKSVAAKDGVQLIVDEDTTVKLVDKAKNFKDTKKHWAKDSIDFVSARGLMNGKSSTAFAPEAKITRARLWTILARWEDVVSDRWKEVVQQSTCMG